MIEYKLSLASSGAVKAPGYEDVLRFGYNKNCGVYRLRVTAADEWKGMKLRAFWHTPEGDPPASLAENGVVEVPAFVTAVPGEGRITFEGSDGTRTITSADMRYRVAANSGTEDGTMPPLGTPAWQQLVGRVEEVGANARKSAEQAQKSMKQAESEKSAAAGSAAAAAKSLKELQDGIAAGDFKGEKGDTGARGPQGDTGPQGPKGETGPAGKETKVDATLKVSGAAADAKATGDALAGKAAASHTHNYAGSSSAGGAANSANKLNTNAGSATQGIYFKDGVPAAMTYTLGKSVPADAKFTDTNTWRGVQDNLTSTATDQSLSANQGKVLKALVDGKAASSHTHNYAGSGSAGGTANSVNGLTFAAQPNDPGAGSSLATNKVLIVYV